MKAFEFFNDYGDTEFPDDCKYIWGYLESIGKINITKRQLPYLYTQFSNENDVGWIEPKADKGMWLEYFAEWLSNKDI